MNLLYHGFWAPGLYRCIIIFIITYIIWAPGNHDIIYIIIMSYELIISWFPEARIIHIYIIWEPKLSH
jgi:hypothetical protein